MSTENPLHIEPVLQDAKTSILQEENFPWLDHDIALRASFVELLQKLWAWQH